MLQEILKNEQNGFLLGKGKGAGIVEVKTVMIRHHNSTEHRPRRKDLLLNPTKMQEPVFFFFSKRRKKEETHFSRLSERPCYLLDGPKKNDFS